MQSKSKPPVLGEPEEPLSQRVSFPRSGDCGFHLGQDEFWQSTIGQGFDPDLWLQVSGSKDEDNEFRWQIDPTMNSPESLSPESDISQGFLPTFPGDECVTDTVNIAQHIIQVQRPIEREIEEISNTAANALATSRKRSGTEAFSMDQTPNDSMRPRQAAKLDSDIDEKTRNQFACPYQKRDSFRHHVCLKYDLRRIKDVKQHVYRRHKQPDYYCAVCFDTFKNADARDKHTRSKDCQDKTDPGFEGITDAQKKELNKSTSRGLHPEEQWFRMWHIIFPGEARPNSVRVGTYMEEMVPLLRSLWANKSPDILAKAQGKHSLQMDHGLLNGVMESIFDCLEVETSASLKIGKPAHATCPQHPINLSSWESQTATTPSRFMNETQEPLFDEPNDIFQQFQQESRTGLEAVILRGN